MSRIGKDHWIVNIPIAHRGLHDGNKLIPENSMLSFKNAIHKGFAIEIDIVFSKDGHIIVFHDYNTFRLCGVDAKVSDLTLAQIKTLYLGKTKERIPTLQEVLSLVDNKVPLLIEIKNRSKVGYFENNLNEVLKNYEGDFAIQSFNPRSLKWFSEQNPAILKRAFSFSLSPC